MGSCQCEGLEIETKQWAIEDIEAYQNDGPIETTRMLAEGLKAEGVQGMTMLDIGGGIGALEYELLRAGVVSVVNVEASSAYIQVAQEEAERQGLADRIRLIRGDFVALAHDIPSADIVTLDHVLCCYDDMERLVSLSVARASKFYGLSYPRDTWWNRLDFSFENFGHWLHKNPFRAYLHPPQAVDALVRKNGFQPRFHRQKFEGKIQWQIVVYARA